MHQGFFPPFHAKGRSLIHAQMQLNAWLRIKEWKKKKPAKKKKVKIRPATPKLSEEDFIARYRHDWQMLWRSWELCGAKNTQFQRGGLFFFLNEPHRIRLNPVKIWRIRHLHLSCCLLVTHLCLSSKGSVMWSTALWQLQLTCYQRRRGFREKINGSDGGLIPVKNAAAAAGGKLIY